LVRVIDGRRLSGLIVETEAYIGPDDQASHAYRNPAGRAAIMFGPAGFAYVYVIYGLHHCLNVVTEAEGFPAAVLIRGLWPEEGIDEMQRRRARPTQRGDHGEIARTGGASVPAQGGHVPDQQLTSGPGKLCQALAIDRSLNGVDLVIGDDLFIEAGSGFPADRVQTGPRIGVRGDEVARSRHWRFYLNKKTPPI
jgi:DNA-3-methyladenine glycosylase